jgi:hypothetical protein
VTGQARSAPLHGAHDKVCRLRQCGEMTLSLGAQARRQHESAKRGEDSVTEAVLPWSDLTGEGGGESRKHARHGQIGTTARVNGERSLPCLEPLQRLVDRRFEFHGIDLTEDVETLAVRSTGKKDGGMPFRYDRDGGMLEGMIPTHSIRPFEPAETFDQGITTPEITVDAKYW